MASSNEVLEEDLARKEATEWALELISILTLLSKCTMWVFLLVILASKLDILVFTLVFACNLFTNWYLSATYLQIDYISNWV